MLLFRFVWWFDTVAGWVPVIQILLWQTSNLRLYEHFTTPCDEALLISRPKNGWRHFWTLLSKIKLGCPWKAFKFIYLFIHSARIKRTYNCKHLSCRQLLLCMAWMLCISTSVQVCTATESWSKYTTLGIDCQPGILGWYAEIQDQSLS